MLELSINNKSFMAVKLPTKETINSENPKLEVIQILSPKRKLIALLKSMGDIGEDDFGKGYEAVAEILSNNRKGEIYSVEYVNELPLADIMAIITSYITFIGSITADPN